MDDTQPTADNQKTEEKNKNLTVVLIVLTVIFLPIIFLWYITFSAEYTGSKFSRSSIRFLTERSGIVRKLTPLRYCSFENNYLKYGKVVLRDETCFLCSCQESGVCNIEEKEIRACLSPSSSNTTEEEIPQEEIENNDELSEALPYNY